MLLLLSSFVLSCHFDFIMILLIKNEIIYIGSSKNIKKQILDHLVSNKEEAMIDRLKNNDCVADKSPVTPSVTTIDITAI